MATYPAGLPSFTTLVDDVDDVLASHQNSPNAEIVAIATELGVAPKTIDDTVSPGASPASVAAYLDMLANIVKTISGAANWYSAAVAAAELPGVIKPYGGRTAPAGYLGCDGTAVSRSTYAALFAILCESRGNPTMTIASPCVVSLTSHGLAINDSFYFTTTGALPTGVSANTLYYVIAAGYGANSFQFSASRGGAAVNTTGSQSGTHTLRWCPWGLGDGSTTFNTPDLRDRALFGNGTAAAIGTNDGVAEASRVLTHTHNYSTVIAHVHNLMIANGGGALQRVQSLGSVGEVSLGDNVASTGSASGTTTATAPGYGVALWIIKT